MLFRCFHGTGGRSAEGDWECHCEPCYHGLECDLICSNRTEAVCKEDACHCGYLGWTGDYCEVLGCPGFPSDCSGHGICGAEGICFCVPGWSGSACSDANCQDNCNSRGVCDDSGDVPKCLCGPGYFGESCQFSCIHGDVANSSCVCDPCYHGLHCSTACNNLGNCTNGICDCGFTGGRGLYCDESGCPGLGEDCSGHGKCLIGDTPPGTCICDEGWRGDGCEIPDCDQDCNGHGVCNTSYPTPRCTCTEGWMGPACEVRCFGRQMPMDSGICVCNDECTHGLQCEFTCNNVGTCVGNQCDCANETTNINIGYYGDYCEIKGCAGTGSLECTDHGICNKNTWVCGCGDGWYGDACQLPDCPGEPDCNQNGEHYIY